ncbi:MAG: hypothetical protein ACXABY_33040 [Candidatus Thorarchaeota archaeon]|jgi:hypothetical protein
MEENIKNNGEIKCPGCDSTDIQIALSVVEYHEIESVNFAEQEATYSKLVDTITANSDNPEKFYCKGCNAHFSWVQVTRANK